MKIIIRTGCIFVFTVADQSKNEDKKITARPEHTHTDESTIMYRHSKEKIMNRLELYGFECLRSLDFPVYIDKNKKDSFRARAYVSQEISD